MLSKLTTFLFLPVILWTLCLLASAESGLSCTPVAREFVDLNIGPDNLVPANPVYDAGVSLCFNGQQHVGQKSCCTKRTESYYAEASENYLRESLRTTNAYFKRLVMDSITQFKVRFDALLISAENHTKTLLTDVYKIPPQEHHSIVSSLFVDLQAYLQEKDINIHESVTQFFNKLFPLVFRDNLNDPTLTSYTEDYKYCLIQQREFLEPQPFGVVPMRIGVQLNRGLTTARSFLEALSVVLEAVNTTDHANIMKECINGVTRLRYCSRCQGYVDVKPCSGFCTNVMRGCLANLNKITQDWDDLMTSMESLTRGMRGPYSVDDIMRVLDTKISEAIMHAMESGPKFYPQVIAKCGHPKISSADSEPKTKIETSYPPVYVSFADKPKEPNKTHDRVEELVSLLAKSKGLYNRVSEMICKNQLFYDQNSSSTNCWNGKVKGAYTHEVPPPDFRSQQKFNPEVRLGDSEDAKLNMLRYKLSHLKQTLHKDEKMQSDWVNVEYGSAYGSDDEDSYYPSGSGSGDGRGYNIPKNNPNSDATEPKITSRKPGVSDRGSGTVMVVSSLYLTLALACLHIFQHWTW